jgi:hypothetical protein
MVHRPRETGLYELTFHNDMNVDVNVFFEFDTISFGHRMYPGHAAADVSVHRSNVNVNKGELHTLDAHSDEHIVFLRFDLDSIPSEYYLNDPNFWYASINATLQLYVKESDAPGGRGAFEREREREREGTHRYVLYLQWVAVQYALPARVGSHLLGTPMYPCVFWRGGAGSCKFKHHYVDPDDHTALGKVGGIVAAHAEKADYRNWKWNENELTYANRPVRPADIGSSTVPCRAGRVVRCIRTNIAVVHIRSVAVGAVSEFDCVSVTCRAYLCFCCCCCCGDKNDATWLHVVECVWLRG